MSLRTIKFLLFVFWAINKLWAKDIFPEVAVGFVHFGNYYEAITEFRRFLFFHEDLAPEKKNAILKEIGDLYFLSKNFDKSQKYYQNLGNSLSRDLLLLDVQFYRNEPFYKDLLAILKNYPLREEEIKILQKEAVRSFVSRGQYRKAVEILSFFNPEDKEIKEMGSWLKQGFPRISYANLFWGIFPGGAHLAVGQYRLGVYSFFTVTILGGIGLWALSQGAFVGAILAFSFAFRYYLSSLSEAFRFIKEENERREKSFQEEFLQKTGGEISFCRFSCSRLELSRKLSW